MQQHAQAVVAPGSRSPKRRSLLAAGGAIALVVPLATMLVAAPAQAATQTATVTYSCLNAPSDTPANTRTDAFDLTVAFDVPDSVAAGSTLNLEGTVSLGTSDSLRSLISSLFQKAVATSDSLTFPTTINGSTTAIIASDFETGEESTTTSPLVNTGTVTLAPITVPADATGNVSVDLPHNGSVASPIDGSPVAFGAQLIFTEGPVAYPQVIMNLACTAPADADLTIASIPIEGTAPEPEPSADSSTSDINVEVPDTTVPDATGLTIAVQPESTTLQGPSTREEGTAWQATGSLGEVQVNDDRRLDGAAWSLSGTASAFQPTGGAGAPISAANLGWAPSKVDGAGTEGPTVAPGTDGGLSTPQVLASGVGVVERNVTTTVTADLTFMVPASAAGGGYGSTLTLTLI